MVNLVQTCRFAPRAAQNPKPYCGKTTNLGLLLDSLGGQALRVLDVDGLNVTVELLLGTLLIVSSSGDADAESEWNTLHTLLPNLLVELGVQADIGGALFCHIVSIATS